MMGAGGQGEDRDDRRRERTEGDQRDRALIGPLLARDHQGREEDGDGDQRTDREQDEAEIEVRARLHRRVGGEHHAAVALEHGDVGDPGADQHEGERDPGELGRRQARVQEDRRGEVEHRDLEEDDPDQEHVEAVGGERQIEPLRRQEMDRLPAGQRDHQAEQAADREEDHGGDRIGLDQRLRRRDGP